MSAKSGTGAEEQRVVFRIPRDAAGNVVQPDMSLNDILSTGEMYPIQAFVADMKAGKDKKDVLAGGIFCAAGHPMVAAYGQKMPPYFRHNPMATAKRTTSADKADTVCPPCGCASVMSHEHLEAQRLLCEHPNQVQITRFKDCGKCVADVFAPGQVTTARREVPERGGRIRTDVVFYDAADRVLMRIEVRHTHRSEEGTRVGLVWCEVYAEHILAAFRKSGPGTDTVVCLAAEPTGERPHCMPCAAAAEKRREDARREREAAVERARVEREAAAERARVEQEKQKAAAERAQAEREAAAERAREATRRQREQEKRWAAECAAQQEEARKAEAQKKAVAEKAERERAERAAALQKSKEEAAAAKEEAEKRDRKRKRDAEAAAEAAEAAQREQAAEWAAFKANSICELEAMSYKDIEQAFHALLALKQPSVKDTRDWLLTLCYTCMVFNRFFGKEGGEGPPDPYLRHRPGLAVRPWSDMHYPMEPDTSPLLRQLPKTQLPSVGGVCMRVYTTPAATVLQVYAKTMIEIQAAILEHRKEKTPPVEAPRAAHCQEA